MKIITLGFLFALIGILIIFIGMFSLAYQARKTGEMEKPEMRGGGIIMIGPIPIIFGTYVGYVKFVMFLAIVLMIIASIFFFLQPRLF